MKQILEIKGYLGPNSDTTGYVAEFSFGEYPCFEINPKINKAKDFSDYSLERKNIALEYFGKKGAVKFITIN